jgi:hypothetical protein
MKGMTVAKVAAVAEVREEEMMGPEGEEAMSFNESIQLKARKLQNVSCLEEIETIGKVTSIFLKKSDSKLESILIESPKMECARRGRVVVVNWDV